MEFLKLAAELFYGDFEIVLIWYFGVTNVCFRSDTSSNEPRCFDSLDLLREVPGAVFRLVAGMMALYCSKMGLTYLS